MLPSYERLKPLRHSRLPSPACRLFSPACRLFLLACALVSTGTAVAADDRGRPWIRHTIDRSSEGADGVRLADVNGNGLLDIATGWEEGNVVRVYLNPGPQASQQPWPAVTVGRVGSPEDAVFVDLDGDGAIDVVSSCEGRTNTMYVHWAPRDPSQYLDPAAWKTEPIPAGQNNKSWMYCLPMQVDGRHGVDLVAGAKGRNAEVGWFEAPADPRNLADWKWHPIYKAGWIMSLFAVDMNGNGRLDILLTDRKGGAPGCYWLENPGPGAAQKEFWKVHPVGGQGQEVMFMVPADLDGDGLLDVVSAVKDGDILYLRNTGRRDVPWESHSIRLPPDTGSGKGVYVADVNLNGRMDIVFSCEHAQGKSGVVWLERPAGQPATTPNWIAHEISGKKEGVKFDLLQMIDLDGDGDLDVITCEERDNLGVIWYENPTRGPKPRR